MLTKKVHPIGNSVPARVMQRGPLTIIYTSPANSIGPFLTCVCVVWAGVASQPNKTLQHFTNPCQT